jgi:hypothetical protein
MKTHDKLRQLLVNDNGFAFDPATGLTYTLSATSMQIIGWLKDGCAEDEIPARLVSEYDTNMRTAKRDVDSFLSTMRAYKLL